MPETTPPVAYLLDLDGTLYAGGAAVPGAPEALERLRRAAHPFRLVTNTTSRSRAMLVERLRGYGFAGAAGGDLHRHAGRRGPGPRARAIGSWRRSSRRPRWRTSRASIWSVASSGRRGGVPEAVILGDLGEGWTYGLLAGGVRVRDGRRGDHRALARPLLAAGRAGLALDAGPFVAGAGVRHRRRTPRSPASRVPRSTTAALGSLGVDDLGPGGDGGRRPLVRRAGRPARGAAGLAGAHRQVPGGHAARLGHHPRSGAAERGRARRRVTPMAGYLSRALVLWSEVAGPAGPAAARLPVSPPSSPPRAPPTPIRPPAPDTAVIRAIRARAARHLRSPRAELAGPAGQRAALRDPGADHPAGAAVPGRASPTTRRGSPNRSATSAGWASSAGSRSTRCGPTPAW